MTISVYMKNILKHTVKVTDISLSSFLPMTQLRYDNLSVYEKYFKTSDILSEFFNVSDGHSVFHIGHNQ